MRVSICMKGALDGPEYFCNHTCIFTSLHWKRPEAIDKPDLAEREKIFMVHLKPVTLHKDLKAEEVHIKPDSNSAPARSPTGSVQIQY